MPEKRSASQILFGYLPEQTVDVRGGVWKVTHWRRPHDERNIDLETLRRTLIGLASAWSLSGKDGGFVRDLFARCSIRVKTLDREMGVELEPFPKLWICKNPSCRRLHSRPDAECMCGYAGKKGQLHFVGYCSDCGDLREPWLRKCRTHNQVRVTFPGTASGSEIVFSCPECNVVIQKGFGFPVCPCGGRYAFNVHRAASVFCPRSVVIVNPPSPEQVRQISDAGGGPRALAWVLDGMRTSTMLVGAPSPEALRRQLMSQGLPSEVVDAMLRAASQGGVMSTSSRVELPADITNDAENEALTIALAMTESRVRIADLIGSSPELHRRIYPDALAEALLEDIELIDKFPVLTGHFGYTRGPTSPGASRLRAYRDRSGSYIVFGDLGETEALFVKMRPQSVAEWARVRGYNLDPWTDAGSARLALLRGGSQNNPSGTGSLREDLEQLVHSYSHRFIRCAAVHAGIDRNALSELLVPLHLGFFVYAAARGDWVLGGLQAVFESELNLLLRDMVHGERRCPLDPGCARGGGACVACLHLGEPSCRLFNTKLSRGSLFGRLGYFSVPGVV
jgi:hypothetical protein